MKLVFAGTPEAAVPSLDALAASGHTILAVLTREDAPVGRKRTLTPSPVATAAERLGLPLIKSNRLDSDVSERVSALEPELGVIVAYGGLIREPLLSTPENGWINLHFSLLPAWRGAAPVQRALMNGDRATGTTVFRLVGELDAGDILDQEERLIEPHSTAGDTLMSLSDSGAEQLLQTVGKIEAGATQLRPQRGETSYAHKLGIEDGQIDWADASQKVYNRFRGVTPEPGAFTTVDGSRFNVLEMMPAKSAAELQPGEIISADRGVVVGTGSGVLQLITVQPAGKKPMRAEDWLRGRASTTETIAR